MTAFFSKAEMAQGKAHSFERSFPSLNRKFPTPNTLREIRLGATLRIGEYEQEINDTYLSMSLEGAILLNYSVLGIPFGRQTAKSLLAQYLFDPVIDGRQK